MSKEPTAPSRPLRVLTVTNMYPTPAKPYCGTFVLDHVRALRAAGVDVDVLFIDGPASKLNYVVGFFRLWAHLCRRRYDIIHAHYVYSGVVARMQFGTPVVITSHGSDTLGMEGCLLRKLYPMVDAVTITSKQNQERVGLLDTHILACGTDTDVFRPLDRAEARKNLGWPADRMTMLYVGRNDPLKRLDILSDAVDIVREQRAEVDLEMVVNAPREKVADAMNAADVFVFASETEGSPVVIKEALACNLPIVSVDVGDVVETISDIDGCYICERNPQSMADHVLKVLDRHQRIDGRKYVEAFSTKAVAQRLIRIFDDVLSRRCKE